MSVQTEPEVSKTDKYRGYVILTYYSSGHGQSYIYDKGVLKGCTCADYNKDNSVDKAKVKINKLPTKA